MFDVLTYEKGAAVVRMLEQYLGEDRFREGIRRYLGAHQYANTETTDLWDAIEEATGEPTRRIMDSWIFQGGYPLIGADIDGGRLVLTQERFTYLPDATPARWDVPVLVAWGTEGGETASRAGAPGRRSDRDRPRRTGRLGPGQPGRLRLLPGRLLVRAAHGAGRPGGGGARAHRALPVPGRSVRGDVGRAGPGPGPARRRPPLRGRDRPLGLATSGRRPARAAPAGRRRGQGPPHREGGHAAGPRLRPTRVPCRSRARAIGTPSSGRSCSPRSARWPKTPTPGPGPPSSTGPT